MRQLTHQMFRWLLQLNAALYSSQSPIFSGLGPLWLLPVSRTETKLRGRRFGSNEGVLEAVNESFEDQNREFYFEGLNKLEHRSAKCIDVEGDNIVKKLGSVSTGSTSGRWFCFINPRTWLINNYIVIYIEIPFCVFLLLCLGSLSEDCMEGPKSFYCTEPQSNR
jgi:hypothetical protein